MKQKHWIMLTSLVGILVAVMIISDLTTKSITHSNDKMDETMDVAEKELGLEGGDSLTGPARALRLAVEGQRQALEQQRKLREQINNMNRTNMHEMGVDTSKTKTDDYEY